MKIAVVGLWHLGTITSLGLSNLGHQTTGFDKNKKIIDDLKKLNPPINEPGINKILKKNLNKNLFFDSELNNLREYKIVWICFDSQINSRDLSNKNAIIKQIKEISKILRKNTIVLISSQISLGTIKILEKYDFKYLKKKLKFVYVPENLRLGKSIELFLRPDRIVFGLRNKKIYQKHLVKIFKNIKCNKLIVSPETAEISKHTINSFLACSISFINEIGQIARNYKVNFEDLEKCLKSDKRLGLYSYLKPGAPFSGGTLARDLNFLEKISKKFNTNNSVIKSIYKSNTNHSSWVKKLLKLKIKSKKFKILQIGLSYTSNTTTLRRSFPFQVFKFIKSKCEVKIYDEYIRLNSNEILNIKKNFLSPSEILNKKFDIILIFQDIKNMELISSLKLLNTLIIDVYSHNKKFFLNKNINYISYEE